MKIEKLFESQNVHLSFNGIELKTIKSFKLFAKARRQGNDKFLFCEYKDIDNHKIRGNVDKIEVKGPDLYINVIY